MSAFYVDVFNDIIRTARARLPGVTEAALKDELLYVLDDFFQESLAWREDITITLVADRDTYELEPEDYNADVCSFFWAKTDNGLRYAASMPSTGILKLRDVPSSAVTLEVTVALTTRKDLEVNNYPEVPNWIASRYKTAFLDGLLSRMYEQPAKPYTSAQMGMWHLRKYTAARTQARVSANKEDIVGGQRWQFPQGFMGTRRQ